MLPLPLVLPYKNPCHCWPTRVCCPTLTKTDYLAPLRTRHKQGSCSSGPCVWGLLFCFFGPHSCKLGWSCGAMYASLLCWRRNEEKPPPRPHTRPDTPHQAGPPPLSRPCIGDIFITHQISVRLSFTSPDLLGAAEKSYSQASEGLVKKSINYIYIQLLWRAMQTQAATCEMTRPSVCLSACKCTSLSLPGSILRTPSCGSSQVWHRYQTFPICVLFLSHKRTT